MMTWRLILSIFTALLLPWQTSSQTLTEIIYTSSGTVRGSIVDVFDVAVDEFLGIPFAQPPLGPLRFRKPQPVKPSSKVRLATSYAPACFQYEEYHYPWYDAKDFKSEDCLYLNIWVPHSSRSNMDNEKKPVMFWIHGGGFSDGSNRIPIYNGKVLAAFGDMIVVTTNYRLSSLGFLTSGTETAPGNVGMYDILEALKWVNKNIDAFGGDPNQVTLAGESAGAVAIGLFCVSPLTKELFRSIIMESGSPAYFKPDNITININKSQKIAEVLGCANDVTNIYDEPENVVKCLRWKKAFDIILAVSSFRSSISESFLPNYGDEIFPVNAREALISGQFHRNINVLIGNNHDEGSFRLTARHPEFFGAFGKKIPQINKELGTALFEEYFKDFPAKYDVIDYYLGNLEENDYGKIREQAYTAMGDFRILCPTKYFAEVNSQYGNDVYYYYFVHRSTTSPWAKWMKVAHFEEVQYVFGVPFKGFVNYTEEEVSLSLRMVTIWSNFVKYGSPQTLEHESYAESSWPLYSKIEPVYVTLGAKVEKGIKGYGCGPHKKNCDFFRPYFGFK